MLAPVAAGELTPIQFVTIREIRVMDFRHAGVEDYFLDSGNGGDFRRGHLARLQADALDEIRFRFA